MRNIGDKYSGPDKCQRCDGSGYSGWCQTCIGAGFVVEVPPGEYIPQRLLVEVPPGSRRYRKLYYDEYDIDTGRLKNNSIRDRLLTCPNCNGRRAIICPKCNGTGKKVMRPNPPSTSVGGCDHNVFICARIFLKGQRYCGCCMQPVEDDW